LDNLGKEDKIMAEKGMKFAEDVLRKKKPRLLILDEANLACHCKILDIKRLLDFLKMVRKQYKRTTVVLTGRHAPRRLQEEADFVNVINEKKTPKRFTATLGIQY
jgi:cob(I)alamin adenosyltransferase